MPSRPKVHRPPGARSRAEAKADADLRRGSSCARGYDAKWRKARAAFLAEHPLCALCEAEGRIEAAAVVDHVIPHKGDYERFWSPENWQPLCLHHHSVKTAKEAGTFGRAPVSED